MDRIPWLRRSTHGGSEGILARQSIASIVGCGVAGMGMPAVAAEEKSMTIVRH